MDGQKTSLRSYKRIVIKVGSALLVDRQHGLRGGWVEALCDDIAALRLAGADVIVVSSGSIALGRTVMQGTGLGPSRGRLKLEESQAAAAIGQIALAKAWSETLSGRELVAGQVLLTLGRYRRAAALSQRPRHHRPAAEGWRRSGDQRKRHRRDRRDSLRRQ